MIKFMYVLMSTHGKKNSFVEKQCQIYWRHKKSLKRDILPDKKLKTPILLTRFPARPVTSWRKCQFLSNYTWELRYEKGESSEDESLQRFILARSRLALWLLARSGVQRLWPGLELVGVLASTGEALTRPGLPSMEWSESACSGSTPSTRCNLKAHSDDI